MTTATSNAGIYCDNSAQGANNNELAIYTPKGRVLFKPRLKIKYTATECAGSATSSTGSKTNIPSTDTSPFSSTFAVESGGEYHVDMVRMTSSGY